MYIRATYIWPDGQSPTSFLRCKEKVIKRDEPITKLEDVPLWGHDGSSTVQALTDGSDCGLQPVYFVPDPILGEPHILVLNEVRLYPSWKPHPSNTRAILRRFVRKYAKHEPLFGLEQEYTMYDRDGVRPLRWPTGPNFPEPQGRWYCGVGSDETYGRPLVSAHTDACIKADISISGTNQEVMPSQWEFQVGPLPPLAVADQLWMARWLLYRLGEDFDISVMLYPKPMPGDWNGTGLHTNFSTKQMRASGGIKAIERACRRLGKFHHQHMLDHVYGEDNRKRLTGRHETCDYHTFRFGIGDRGGSIRIPAAVAKEGRGYLEDRRPAANMDPYRVTTAVLATVCGEGFDPRVFKYFEEKRGGNDR